MTRNRARGLEPSLMEPHTEVLVEFVESATFKAYNGEHQACYAAFVLLRNGGSNASVSSEAALSSADPHSCHPAVRCC